MTPLMGMDERWDPIHMSKALISVDDLKDKVTNRTKKVPTQVDSRRGFTMEKESSKQINMSELESSRTESRQGMEAIVKQVITCIGVISKMACFMERALSKAFRMMIKVMRANFTKVRNTESAH